MNRLKFNNLQIPFMHIHVFNRIIRFFMAPRLVREPSGRAYNSYKDIRIHSFYHTPDILSHTKHTHTLF